MSTVKIEPFSFETEENGVQLKPEQLPGAIEISSEDNKEEKPVVTKQDPKRSESVAIDTDEEESEEEENDNSNDPFNLFAKNDKSSEGEDEEENLSSEKVDYKAFADYFVETGIWKDFEGREDIEYSEETFQALWKAQADNTVREYLTEERSQFGDAANQLIDYLKTLI
jgi:hypothetical protein